MREYCDYHDHLVFGHAYLADTVKELHKTDKTK